MKQMIELNVNGVKEEVLIEPWWTLAEVLRDQLNLMSVKVGCNKGDCGSCTVLVNGEAVKSCLLLAAKANGKDIVTVEGLSMDDKLDPLQEAFIEHFAVQCGFCTPGMILCAKALLNENPDPTEQEIREALRGNLCRCTGYVKIIEAVLAAKGRLNIRSSR